MSTNSTYTPYRFELGGKALRATELEDGDLVVEGLAAVWDGDDRVGENFAPGAFKTGLDRFLNGQASLCWHHRHDQLLGRVLELREEGKGLFMRARVDHQEPGSPLRHLYNSIRKGSANGLSTYGYFTRGVGAMANKIVGVDLVEISITPAPVHPGTSLAVVAGKALGNRSFGDPMDALTRLELAALRSEIADLSSWAVKAELRQLAGRL